MLAGKPHRHLSYYLAISAGAYAFTPMHMYAPFASSNHILSFHADDLTTSRFSLHQRVKIGEGRVEYNGASGGERNHIIDSNLPHY